MAFEDEDLETEEAALWRRTVEILLARGNSPSEAIDGANLVLQSYRRQRQVETQGRPEPEPPDDMRGTGLRRRVR